MQRRKLRVTLICLGLLVIITAVSVSCTVEYHEYSDSSCAYQFFTFGLTNSVKSLINHDYQVDAQLTTCGNNPPGMQVVPSNKKG